MRKAKSFGVRGMSAEERAAANPYLGTKTMLGGNVSAGPAERGTMTRDENLRAFMLQVYNFMFIGLLITAATAFATYQATVTTDPNLAMMIDDQLFQITETEYLRPLGVLLWATDISYVVCFGPLAILLFCGGVFRGCNPVAGMVVFGIVAALIGVSFSGLALTYTNGSITRVFFVTAAAFGGLSLLGYTTRQDLSGWGSFLWMGFFGLLVSSIVNIFIQSDVIQFAVCSIGVIVFAGFTAYDTQMIKEAYNDKLGKDQSTMLALNGAIDLYLDFINLFRFLLFFLGDEE